MSCFPNGKIQYDLLNSSIPKGILVLGTKERVEQSSIPTACMWHPYSPSMKEELILICNNEYKIKALNSTNKNCRKTVLSPTYGGPLNSLILLPKRKDEDMSRFIAYSTHEKVIGLIKLDLDGNPNK
jgi:hypothetical protein